MVNFSLVAFVALFIHLGVTPVYAQSRVVVIPLFGDEAPTRYSIGDTGPAGGIVFHVTNGGLNGLEAAPVDQTEAAPWNCLQTDLPGLFNVGVAATVPATPDSNSGASNTPLIATECPGFETNAAVYAAAYVWPNGQSDGYLPNIDELNLLYAQKAAVGGFANIYYWSSSEHDLFSAWEVDFFDGTNLRNQKDGKDRVRAIRAF